MSFMLMRSNYWLSALVGLSGLLAVQLRAQDKFPRRELELSETNSLEVFTNLNELGSRLDGLRQDFEDELNNIRHPSRSSLDGVLAPSYYPPAARTAPSNKSKDELDLQSFLFQDMLPGGQDDMSQGNTGGRPKTQKEKTDLYYEMLGVGNLNPNASVFGDAFNSLNAKTPPQSPQTDDDPMRPSDLSGTQQSFKNFLGENSDSVFTRSSSRGALSGFLGTVAPMTAQQVEARKNYMDDYRKILDDSSPDAVINPLYAPVNSALPQSTNYGILGALPSSTRDGLTTIPAAPPPVRALTTVPDLNSTVLNQWNPMYVAPAPQPAKPSPSSFYVPMMETPRRKF